MIPNMTFDAAVLRRTVIEMAYCGGTGHIGCALSLIEIVAVLYRSFVRYPDHDPQHPRRDYLVLSKGHGVMAQYACLQQMGWLQSGELDRYFEDGSRLHGLSESHVPGLEVSSGSLGHGLSVGVGLALAAKRRGTDQMCYAIIGDGEANEGSIWEALGFASQFQLDNLVVIIDQNGFQAMGPTPEVMDMGDLAAKLAAFGLETETLNGHDETALTETIGRLAASKNGKPKGIIAETVKGKGISFMEGENIWHYARLKPEQYDQACAELAVQERA